MPYRKKLIPGLPMELVPLDGEYVGTFKTRIEEVGERLISIGAPISQGEVIPLREGTKVKLTFWDEVAAYSFEAKIKQRLAVPVPMFVIALPDSFSKVQRRGFVRVPASFPITYRSVTREGLSDLHKGNMIDISGGGMRFSTEERLESKSLLYTQVSLPNGDVQTPVRVCRVLPMEDKNRYSISVEFHEISERERDKIIRCVFEIQRSLRRKGLV